MWVIGSLSEEPCGPWLSCGDGMRLAGWFVVRRAFAPRRLYGENEFMALLVVVNRSVIPLLKRLLAHKLLVLAGGSRWQRWLLVVRECTG